jgi:hypothetical protein
MVQPLGRWPPGAAAHLLLLLRTKAVICALHASRDGAAALPAGGQAIVRLRLVAGHLKDVHGLELLKAMVLVVAVAMAGPRLGGAGAARAHAGSRGLEALARQ